MSAIRSIIVFNGGSAGDFLKIICLEQLNSFNRYTINDKGTIRTDDSDNYLKELCKTEKYTNCHQLIDINRCLEIENAHSYHHWFQELTPNLFYIHYNDIYTQIIVQTFMYKRQESDFAMWVKKTMPPNIPRELIEKINQENFSNALSIFWKKNMREWQSNSMLTPIPLQDFFDSKTLTKWVERLCGQPISDKIKFNNTHQAWLDKNSELISTLL